MFNHHDLNFHIRLTHFIDRINTYLDFCLGSLLIDQMIKRMNSGSEGVMESRQGFAGRISFNTEIYRSRMKH
jgi:hypothetical protein